jgi:hypothetical protein
LLSRRKQFLAVLSGQVPSKKIKKLSGKVAE